MFSAIAAALGAADKVIELIQRVPKMPEAGSLRPSTFYGRLELQDVSFSYPSRPTSRVLDSISLRVNPGEVCLHLSFICFAPLAGSPSEESRFKTHNITSVACHLACDALTCCVRGACTCEIMLQPPSAPLRNCLAVRWRKTKPAESSQSTPTDAQCPYL